MLERAGGKETLRSAKPLDELKAILRGYRSPKLPEMPPFTGGAIGFFGYDLLQYYEKLPAHRVDDLNMDDMQFMFCDQVIVFDHVKQRILLVANVHVKEGDRDEDIRRSYELAERKLDEAADLLHQEGPGESFNRRPLPVVTDLGDVRSNLTKEQFIANVEKGKEYIRAGDIFQVVLSQRFHIETEVDPLHVYRCCARSILLLTCTFSSWTARSSSERRRRRW
ncbi:hypothetical protein HMSSN036_04670 [Paenibacillus macerans]|nr:hypothetical protein HMSSN036_04670 [Paenibacillus macerans]